jgi:hypothetical protein
MNNTPEVWAAIITSAVALIGVMVNSIVLYRSTIRAAEKQHQLETLRQERDRREKSAEVISSYREPLLRAADSLQSRLYNILKKNFLSVYLGQSGYQTYAINSTLYAFAEYLGWVGILRRNLRYLDLGEEAKTRELEVKLRKISETLLTEQFSPYFKLFRVEQNAIGEIMIVQRASAAHEECMGYVEFTRRQSDPLFAHWFERLRSDIIAQAADPANNERLVELQNALIALMDELDPKYLRIPKSVRQPYQAPSI